MIWEKGCRIVEQWFVDGILPIICFCIAVTLVQSFFGLLWKTYKYITTPKRYRKRKKRKIMLKRSY